jgi:regulator of sirC expression with transglutaminase-like and TPR domain
LSEHLVRSFAQTALSPDPDLAVAALMIARIEYPRLDAGPYLDRLDAIGREARVRVEAAASVRPDTPRRADPERYSRVMALNEYLFTDLQFVGNSLQYQDPRNSFLNEVLDRRTGIPITLALVYMEVARRAGVPVDGVNFPGHFLLRCPAPRGIPDTDDLIIDAFHGGALLSEDACRGLLRRHQSEHITPDSQLLVHATKPEILARMLLNLKRVYVQMYSFQQAWAANELIFAVDPSSRTALRDRGLLAYHLKDFGVALRSLQTYLALPQPESPGQDEREEQSQIWEHVKTLQQRLASFN